MPTYQYSCTECGHFFEQVQSFSDASLTECPACQGRLRKVFNAVGVVFKGSGFYRTDSRSENGAKTPSRRRPRRRAGGGRQGRRTANGSKDSGSKDSGGSERLRQAAAPRAAAARARAPRRLLRQLRRHVDERQRRLRPLRLAQ